MKKGRLILLLISISFSLFLIAFYYFYHDSNDLVFHDLTVELGTPSLTIQDFVFSDTYASDIAFVSDVTKIDLGQVGSTTLTLRHGSQEETVTLTVVDTTSPEADVMDACQIPITGFPEAIDLVSNIQDMSPVTVFYRDEPYVPLDYADLPVTIVIQDAWGNRTEKKCIFSFRWMPESVTVELGEEITENTVLLNPSRDALLLNPICIQQARSGGIGEYIISSTCNGQYQECVLLVQDTIGPELFLRDVQSRYGQFIKLDDFLVRAEDPSGIREIRLLTEVDHMPYGQYDVLIEAEDKVGNITQESATLYVTSDYVVPVIHGDMTEFVLKKGAELPDFLDGIYATDNSDGTIPVECDLSNIDFDVGGTHYITYRAIDSSGNTAVRERKIVIVPDEADTARIVKEIAASFEDDDIEGLWQYVCYGLWYNSEWGGDNPVYFGFTERRGNCYVHALCFKALLDAKGIPNHLIWTTCKSHYWVMVKINNEWKHIDPTPSKRYLPLYMNDTQRKVSLSGRDWDHSQWPSCE